MFIVYDFETSSRHLLGQIISYAFILCNERFEPIDHCKGFIKLNRIQCPEVGAILTNKCDVAYLQEHGESEYEAAHKMRDFIQNIVNKYGQVTLVGFNSNSFDLSFLRTTFIRYGLNPYFMGKVKNLDILHWAQYLAFYQADKFPWVLANNGSNSYYSFRLEDLTHAAGLLNEAQSHDAMEDVLLTIDLIKYFEGLFNERLADFSPVQIPLMEGAQQQHLLFKQRQRDFVAPGESPKKYHPYYYMSVSISDKSYLFLDVQRFKDLDNDATEADKSRCLRYVNTNKAFFICEPADDADKQAFADVESLMTADPFFQRIINQPEAYFDVIKKEQDIDYQIHELGFKRIDTLFVYVQQLMNDPNKYTDLLKDLLAKRKDEKDNYLIQLFNRVYLNYHPNPNPEHLKRYLIPRYVEGTMYNEEGYNNHLQSEIALLDERMNDDSYESDLPIMQHLKQYYDSFQTAF